MSIMMARTYLHLLLVLVCLSSAFAQTWNSRVNLFKGTSESFLSCNCVKPIDCNDDRVIRCGDQKSVCCRNLKPKRGGEGNAQPLNPPKPIALQNTDNGDNGAFNLEQFIGSATALTFDNKTCGLSTPEFSHYDKNQIRTNEALENEFPWTVIIYEAEREVCTGVLYELGVVITTATCVAGHRAADLRVVAGEWILKVTDEKYDPVEKRVAKIRIHDYYSAISSYSDIAILFLESNYQVAPNIRPVCHRPERLAEPCYATGWGARNKIIINGPNRMKKIKLKLIPADVCTKQLRTVFGDNYSLSNTNFCAVGIRGDTEFGDGGGPLMCMAADQKPKQTRYTLVGLTSYGKFTEEGLPGVYVAVPKFAKWIDDEYESFLTE